MRYGVAEGLLKPMVTKIATKQLTLAQYLGTDRVTLADVFAPSIAGRV